MSGYFFLNGKVALVTGGSRGLGFHAATALLQAGAKSVIVSSRKAEGTQGINQAVDRLNALASKDGLTGQAVGIPANVADVNDIERLVQEVEKREGTLDILIANAGATWGGPFESTPDWSNQKVLDLNVRGVFNLTRLFTPLLARAGSAQDPSRVIIMSSTAGSSVAHVGDNGTIMYSISKAAVHHLTRNLAIELGPRHITCNTIAPGFFPSKLANGLIEILGGQDALERANPRGRLGEPADIAGAVVFLCSQAGSYVNGEDIALDGGQRLSSGRLSKM